MSSDKKIESITIPYNKVPDTNILSDLRHAMEVQFRYKFYKDVQFPYLHSLGIRNVLQGFGNEDVGFIGILHLWWVNEDSGIVYDNPRKGQVLIKGMWKSEWFDSAAAGIAAAQKITKERIYDEEKLVMTAHNYILQKEQERAQKEAVRLLQEQQGIESPAEEEVEKEAKKVILWN